MFRKAIQTVFTKRNLAQSYSSALTIRPVKVLSIKTVSDLFHVKGVDDYTEMLTDQAKKFPGYIKSTYYWQYPEMFKNETIDEKEYTLVTESDWDDIESWNKWLDSESRRKIQNEYKGLFSNIEHIVLLKKPEVVSFTM